MTEIGHGWIQRSGDEWRGEVLLSGCIRMPVQGRLSERNGRPALALSVMLPRALEMEDPAGWADGVQQEKINDSLNTRKCKRTSSSRQR